MKFEFLKSQISNLKSQIFINYVNFVYTENINGSYKKAAFEAVSYAKAVADQSGTDVIAVSINPTDSAENLYKYGASKVITLKTRRLKL